MTVDFDVREHVGILTIDRPEARNAVNGDVAQGIEAGIDRLEESEDLWVGILTGNGPVFSAGADLKAINSGRAGELMTERGGFAGLVERQRTKPLIAAVDGPALAGGTEITLACDLIVASTAAQFGIPEVKRSLVAAGAALFRLPRVLPPKIAMELGLTGDPITPEVAHAHGMVNVLCEPGEALDKASELAGRICANAPVAVRETRRLMLELVHADDKTGIEESNRAMGTVMATEDFNEGLTAFIEKRPPEWKGR
ncbi:MAG: crotonase/enoyl-CoA hydratase family protein [Acidimicrobiia bacterium]|nr:crotonase/enoyl-CoA hydratase family protein [Acidimicrobiia bacterium]